MNFHYHHWKLAVCYHQFPPAKSVLWSQKERTSCTCQETPWETLKTPAVCKLILLELRGDSDIPTNWGTHSKFERQMANRALKERSKKKQNKKKTEKGCTVLTLAYLRKMYSPNLHSYLTSFNRPCWMLRPREKKWQIVSVFFPNPLTHNNNYFKKTIVCFDDLHFFGWV